MNLLLNNIRKAAAITAAFCIFGLKAHAVSRNSFPELKKKVEQLFLDKKRKEAFDLIEEFLKNSSIKPDIEKAKDLRIVLGKKFLTQEAQNFYEQSLNATLENRAESKKLIEQCLALEPTNLDCQIQNMRLEYREAAFNKTKEFAAKAPKDIQDMDWIRLTLLKKEKDFKNTIILKKIPDETSESNMIMVILELERSLQSKNYAMAKEALAYMEKNYSDWPEIVLFKQKIDMESSENDLPSYEKNQNQDILASYQAKCKSLNKTSIRRFRYDFDLCLRGN